MKSRKIFVWLASAFVTIITALMLAGCPHNGLIAIDSENTGDSTGGRAGNGNVTLVITNFIQGGNIGAVRTIAPGDINLKDGATVDKYVFLASGTSSAGQPLEARRITIGPDGSTSLPISGTGRWRITVKAYDKKLLEKEGVPPDTSTDEAIAAKETTCLVLSGTATVVLTSGNTVTLTLTNDNVKGDGTIDVAVVFDSATDVDTIFDDNTANPWKVTAELVDLITHTPIADTEVELWNPKAQTTPTDTDPGKRGTPFNQDAWGSVTPPTSVPDQKKVLRYDGNTETKKVPKGKYQLRVTVENTDTQEKLYWADSNFYVEGNRITTGSLVVTNIIGFKPAEPTDFHVHWKKPTTTDTLVGYDAFFEWKHPNYNAVGAVIEVADITDIYVFNGGETKVKTKTDPNGKVFAGAEALWEDILDVETEITKDDRSKYVATLKWNDPLQGRTEYPRYLAGSLMGAGTDGLTVRLRSGRVYSARIRIDNGSSNFSEWTYIGAGSAHTDKMPDYTRFEVANTKGIFNLLKIVYDLKDEFTLWELKAEAADNKVKGTDRQVTADDLFVATPYQPGTDVTLTNSFGGDKNGLKAGDFVLVKKGTTDILPSWSGWKDQDGKLYGPAKTDNPPVTWTKDDWKYGGYTDITLTPVGVGGSSINVNAETAGTFNVLTLDTIGFGTAEPSQSDQRKLLSALTDYTRGTTKTPGFYKKSNGQKHRLVIIIDEATANTDTSKYFISIGDKDEASNDSVMATLSDKNKQPIKLNSLYIQLIQGNAEIQRSGGFKPATETTPAYASFSADNSNSLKGLESGDYFLDVQMETSKGSTQSLGRISVAVLTTAQADTVDVPAPN